MSDVSLPNKIRARPKAGASRSCPAHRAWIRRHHCCVPDCKRLPIECAHVRSGSDGGMGLKPSDRWAISLCVYHHREQHQLGERKFEHKHGIELVALAEEFARRSPHSLKLSAWGSRERHAVAFSPNLGTEKS